MAKINIKFNNAEYQIDESALTNATNSLLSHLSTTMSGSGATVNLGGVAFNIDSTKLSSAKNDFVSHLGTIAGSGSKVVVGGIEYGIDSEAVVNSINALNTVFNNLQINSGIFTAGLYETGAFALYNNQGDKAIESMLITSWDELVSNGVVVINEGAVSIGENAQFSGDLLLPNDGSVTSIDTYGFKPQSESQTVNLTSIVIPERITAIGEESFASCAMLANIAIPSSLKNIGKNAFKNCTNLKNVHITDMSAWCNISIVNTYANPCWNNANLYLNGALVTDLVIPSDVTTISSGAFYGCGSLTSVTLHDNVEILGSTAFSKCANLVEVTLGKKITAINKNTFKDCTSLNSIIIPDSVTDIGSQAFYGCITLSSITIPANVVNLGASAFTECTALTEINFQATAMNDLAERSDPFLSAGINGNGITLNIAANVTKIPAHIFAKRNPGTTQKITAVIFAEGSMCQSIGKVAFYGCEHLTSLTVPDSVTSIGIWAFRNTGLTSIILGNSVADIGERACQGCSELVSITIPDTLTGISDWMFYDCESLENITFEGTTAQWNALTKGINWNTNVPATYVQCSDGKVDMNGNIIPDEEERLEGDGAEYYTLAPTALSFRSTAPLNELQEIQINGVTVDPSNYTLEEGSTIVTFPIDYLKTLNVGSYEVAVASDSKTVKGDFTVTAPELNEYGFYYNQPYTAYVGGYGSVVLFFKNDGVMDLRIIENGHIETGTYLVNGNAVTCNVSLGTIPVTIASEGAEMQCDAFGVSFKLYNESIISDGDYIYAYDSSIGGYIVSAIDKTKASYIAIKTGIYGLPTVKLATEMFKDNTNLVVAPEIPYGVTDIDVDAFRNCSSMTNVTIPNSVTNIHNCAFINCTSLTNIMIPDSVTYMGNAFICCTNLKSIEIPSNLSQINASTFEDCTSLISVVISDSVTIIGANAFRNCTNLTSIVFEGTVEQWNAVSKWTGAAENWNYNVPATYVQCSDGQVAL